MNGFLLKQYLTHNMPQRSAFESQCAKESVSANKNRLITSVKAFRFTTLEYRIENPIFEFLAISDILQLPIFQLSFHLVKSFKNEQNSPDFEYQNRKEKSFTSILGSQG